MIRTFLLSVLILVMACCADAQQICDQSFSVNLSAGSSGTIGSSVQAQQVVSICGYEITGSATGTTVQFSSNNVAITGVMVTPANGPLEIAKNTPLLFGTRGQTVTVACGTGSCNGFVNFGQF